MLVIETMLSNKYSSNDAKFAIADEWINKYSLLGLWCRRHRAPGNIAPGNIYPALTEMGCESSCCLPEALRLR